MEAQLMFLDCPAYLDRAGAERCGLPAEVRCRLTMSSADGPLGSAMIRCPAGHRFKTGHVGNHRLRSPIASKEQSYARCHTTDGRGAGLAGAGLITGGKQPVTENKRRRTVATHK